MRIAILIFVALFTFVSSAKMQREIEMRGGLDRLFEEVSTETIVEKTRSTIELSDGNFEALSEKWRDGISWLVKTGRCKAYDHLIWWFVGGNRFKYLLAKAQMMVESGCRPSIIGGGTDYGLFQVQRPTCAEVGFTGDLLDPATNIQCALAYRKALCKRYRHCALPDLFVAYNVGPTGSARIKDKRAFEYARKIHFAVSRLVASR